MSSTKLRHKQSSSDRGAQSSQWGMAKKSPKVTPGAAPSRSIDVWKTCHFLFYAGLLALAAFSGWCCYNLLAEVAEITRQHEDFSRHRVELTQSMEGTLKQVNSLQVTVGNIEAILKDSKQKQELTDKAVWQADIEVKRIDNILKKMQNEILKDLSDGIQDVKNARERDFPFFEKTVEEKLTDLTTSINDNIATFTEVQRTSQNEIRDIKQRMALLEGRNSLKDELWVLKNATTELETSMNSNKNAIELLKNRVESVENAFYNEVKEVPFLKQEYESLKMGLGTAQSAVQALTDNILKVEESSVRLPNEMERLNTELQQLKDAVIEQENALSSEKQALIEINKNTSEHFESRLRVTEENVESLNLVSAQQSEKMDAFLFGQDEFHRRLDALDVIRSEASTSDSDSQPLVETVFSLTKAQEALSNDVDELKQGIHTKASEFQKLKDEVNSLHDRQNDQIDALKSNQEQRLEDLDKMFDNIHSAYSLEKLASIEGAVGGLSSSVSQAESDLKMLRTVVDNLVAYSVKIETNENNLASMKDSLEEFRSEIDKLLEKIEILQESV